jgi:uncharacterized damage-inducible protein DinB
MQALFKEQARYNAWMNKNLYARLGDIPDTRRKEDAGLFFKSLHGTLNHLLLVDKLWLGRLQNQPFSVESLDQELYADFAQLRLQHKKSDRHLTDYVDNLSAEDLQGELRYVSVRTGEQQCFPVALVLAHLFNHQTHHRGQITAAMSRQGLDYGVTDMIFMPNAGSELSV